MKATRMRCEAAMQRGQFAGTAVLGVVAALMLAACSANGAELPREAWQVATEVPAGAPALAEDQASSDGGGAGSLIKGLAPAQFFAQNCAVCHGARREGGVGLPLTPDHLVREDSFYQDTIRNGRVGTAMAPMGTLLSLSDEEIAALVRFLKADRP